MKLLVVGGGAAGTAAAWLAACAGAAPADESALLHRVRILAHEDMAGRATGTAGALAAADSVAGWFARTGLSPPPALGGWFQDFPLSPDDPAGGTGRNVLGWLPGEGALAERVLVIGAHYDHLGLQLADDGRTVLGVYHGAEDNASGVSVLVALAAQLAAHPGGERRSCLFAAFAGEEIGLLGSTWLARHPTWLPGTRGDTRHLAARSEALSQEGRGRALWPPMAGRDEPGLSQDDDEDGCPAVPDGRGNLPGARRVRHRLQRRSPGDDPRRRGARGAPGPHQLH